MLSCWLVALCTAGGVHALTPDDLVLYVSGDKGLQPDKQPVGHSKPTVAGTPEIVPGKNGKAIKLRNGVDSVAYYLHTYAPRQGTLSFWLSAENWDGSTADALQVLMHTGGKEAHQQQIVLQTLSPNPGLAALFYRYGEAAGGFPACRSAVAPLRRANDAMSVLRKGEWYHYAVAWRDGQVTFYFDGQAVAKQTFNDLKLEDIGGSLILGWKKDVGRLFTDPGTAGALKANAEKPWESLIDDLALFRRCLSAKQIAQLAKAGPVECAKNAEPDDPAFALKTDYLQTPSRLWATVSNMNTPDNKERRGTLQVLNAQNQAAGKCDIILPAGQSDCTLQLELPNLPEGQYTVKLDLQDERGVVTVANAFERVNLAWLGNKLGAEDIVLAPWTPVKVTKGDAVTVEVWGRLYKFAGPLPSSIIAQGEELLAAPMAWFADAGQGDASLKWSAPAVESSSATAIVLTSTSKAGDYAVQARVKLEYDGFAWCEFRFSAPKPATLNALRAEIAFPKEITTFLQHPCARVTWFPKPKKPFLDAFGHETPYLWVCNDRVGLQWCFESDQWWYAKDRKKQMEVAANDKGGVARIHFVKDAVEMPAEFTLTYGLMATPVRPRAANWRGWGNATTYRLAHRDVFVPISLDYSHWSVAPGWVQPGNPEAGKGKWRPDKEGLWMPFTSGCFYGLRPFSGAKEPDKWFPEWVHFYPEWWRMPDPNRNVKGEAWNEGMVIPSPSFTDHFIWQADGFFRDYDVDGLYFDGFPGMLKSTNYMVGMGYTDRDGSLRPTFPIRAGREMMRRLYAVIQRQRGDKGFLFMHTSTSFTMPVLSFSHAILDGEFLFWHDIGKPMEEKGPLVALTEDRMRTTLNLRQSGLVLCVDARKIAQVTRDAHTARRVIAQFLLNDVPAFGDINGYNSIVMYPLDWWGIAEPGVEFIPYYDEKPPAAPIWEGRVSGYVNRAKGKVLLVCTNDSGYHRSAERLAREKNFGYEVKLSLERLGLRSGAYKATDAESLGTLPIPCNNDTLSFTMEPGAVKLIALEQAR